MARVSKKNKLISLLSDHIDKDNLPKWEGTLEDYISLIVDNPQLHMSSHERVLAMIESHGVETDDDENTRYNFFSKDLFGINDAISQIMEYMRAAATGSEVSRRILLLYGPTSSGKSQLAILLKRGLENRTWRSL